MLYMREVAALIRCVGHAPWLNAEKESHVMLSRGRHVSDASPDLALPIERQMIVELG